VPGLEWDRKAGYLRLNPPHTADSEPLDLEIVYSIHNCVPLSRWDAIEMECDPTDSDWTFHRATCSTRRTEVSVELPSAFHGTSAAQFRAYRPSSPGPTEATDAARLDELDEAVKWHPAECRASINVSRPETGLHVGIRWSLPGGEPAAKIESLIQPIRAWQARLADAHARGERPLDNRCQELAETLTVTCNVGPVDVCLFLPSTAEVRAQADQPQRGLLLVGDHTTRTRPPTFTMAYGQGIAGRTLRTGKVIWYHRLLAEDARRRFERGEIARPPDMSFVRIAQDRDYPAVLGVPIEPDECREDGRPVPPCWTVLVASIAPVRLNSPLAVPDRANQAFIELVAGKTRDFVTTFIYQEAAAELNASL
jgi:hypothetical protein